MHSSLTIDKVEQNTLKSYIVYEIKSLSNFKTPQKILWIMR